MQLPPEHTVARDAAEWAEQTRRPPLTASLLKRGQERYGIYCSMCHGFDGSGDGTVLARGFPRPAEYRADVQYALDSARIYHTIPDLLGVRYGFRDPVTPRDLRALSAYLKAFQKAGNRSMTPKTEGTQHASHIG